MIPTPPATPSRSNSSPRPTYRNSSRFYQDHRQMVDIGVQVTGAGSTPPTSPSRDVNESTTAATPPPLGNPTNFPLLPYTVDLSDQQKHILDIVKSGKNVFFTGPAGTGKSVLLRAIIDELRNIWGRQAVAVTATTGVAGVNVGGTTLHSFAGIGLGKEKVENYVETLRNSIFLKSKWDNTRVLIIDEISMMDGRLFDKLEQIAREVRGIKKPFGGLQLVLCGDFFQLPPVPDKSYNYQMASLPTFDALTWSICIPQTYLLTQVFRQKDNTFVELLSAMRVGNMTSKHIAILKGLSRLVVYDDGIEPCELFAVRAQVESCNNSRLAALPGPQHRYKSIDRAGYDYRGHQISMSEAQVLLHRLVAPADLTLKVNAQVMLIQNIVQGVLVNGSAGKVVEFLTISEAVARNIAIAELKQTNQQENQPRRPPKELVPLGNNTFGKKEKWPLVRFINGHELLCAPVEFTCQGFVGNTEASRLQVPLLLSWAMSIHKSQGQTLERVKVDLGRAFEKGQVYVAISRATKMEQLEIVNFDPGKIVAHPRVVQWHHELDHAEAKAAAQNLSYNIDMMDCEEAIASYPWDS